jgi:hypothetical protein
VGNVEISSEVFASLQFIALIIAFVISVVTCGAGIWMMRYGYKLTEQQTNLLGLKGTVQTSLTAVKDTVVEASNTIQEGLPTTDTPNVAPAPDPGPTTNNPTTTPTAAQTQAATQQMQAATQQTQAATQQMQAATQTFSGTADYVRGLAELAKNLTDLTPAVSAFVVSTILFFFAGSIATAIIFAVF